MDKYFDILLKLGVYKHERGIKRLKARVHRMLRIRNVN